QQQVAAERGVMQTPVLELSKWKGEDILLAIKPSEPRKALIDVDEPTTIASAAPSTSSPSAQSHSLAAGTIPDVSGLWVGSNGVKYNYWQKGRSIGWEMPEMNEVCRGMISEDGKMQASQWSGTNNGAGTAIIDTDGSGRAMKMTCNDGVVLIRPEMLALAQANGQQALSAQTSVTAIAPQVQGNWMGSNGAKYKVWQKGTSFGWKNPKFNEVGMGQINPDGKSGSCTWTGPAANSCTFVIEFDGSGKPQRMVTNLGSAMSRMD
ncbi:MAG: hypothetical protein IAF58_10800, partial [Leptolyngbya sp.]|nr:hypothetical protein [Candidatus Melainabacteria bacterium]